MSGKPIWRYGDHVTITFPDGRQQRGYYIRPGRMYGYCFIGTKKKLEGAGWWVQPEWLTRHW